MVRFQCNCIINRVASVILFSHSAETNYLQLRMYFCSKVAVQKAEGRHGRFCDVEGQTRPFECTFNRHQCLGCNWKHYSASKTGTLKCGISQFDYPDSRRIGKLCGLRQPDSWKSANSEMYKMFCCMSSTVSNHDCRYSEEAYLLELRELFRTREL